MVQYDEKIINAENQKIKEAYTELGELYYKAHKKDYESGFEGPVSKIKAAEKAIEQHKAEVLKQNGLMLCKHCGAQIQDVSRFCNFCGKSVDEPAEEEEKSVLPVEAVESEDEVEEEIEIEETEADQAEETVEEEPEKAEVCPVCGETVEDDYDFCTNCGYRIKQAEQDILSNDGDQRVCRVCGSKLTDDMLFCEECGTRVDDGMSEKKEKVCPICGFTTTDEEMNFCVECGSKLR